MRPLFRLEPVGRPDQYVTHAHTMPKGHTRIVDCKTFECEAYERGWKTVLDVSDPQKYELAVWVRDHGARRFQMSVAGTIVTFVFPPGQMCFAEHRVPTKPGLFVIRDGDHRAATGRSRKVSARTWVDDLGEQTEKLAEIRRRG